MTTSVTLLEAAERISEIHEQAREFSGARWVYYDMATGDNVDIAHGAPLKDSYIMLDTTRSYDWLEVVEAIVKPEDLHS